MTSVIALFRAADLRLLLGSAAGIWLRCLLLILLTATAPASFAAPTLVLEAEFRETNLAGYVDLLEDPGGDLNFQEVTAAPLRYEFRPTTPSELQLSGRLTGLWFRFALHNPENQARSFILQVRPADLAALTLYRAGQTDPSLPPAAYDATQRVEEAEHVRPRQAPAPELTLQIPANTTQLYYLQIHNDTLHRPDLQLYSVERYLTVQGKQERFTGVALGVLLALAGVSLTLFLLHRQSLFLLPAGLGILFALTQSVLQGELAAVGAGGPLWRHLALAVALALGVLANVLLLLKFPLVPRGSRWAPVALWSCFGICVSLLPVLVLAPSRIHLGIITSALISAMLVGGGVALHTFMRHHSRAAISYALLRVVLLLMLLVGLSARHNAGIDLYAAPVLVLLAGCIETGGLLLLLMGRQLNKQADAAQRERQVAVAEAESRSRTEVIAEVGHRIRTPASGVLGMLEILQDSPLSPTQRDYLSTAQRAGNELLNAIEELNDIALTQKLSHELQQSTFDPEVLVAECVDGFRSLAKARSLELITDPAPELPAFVSGDPTRLRQILLQLLQLLVGRFENGEIVLRLAPVASAGLAFELRAQGERSERSRPRSDMERRIHPPGSDTLRLAIARQLVATLGGKLQIDDRTPGQMQIRVELPLPGTGGIATELGFEQWLRGKQLLLVDDNSTFCEVLRRQASTWGMQVHAASSATEALAWLRNRDLLAQPVDVLLLDADMPEVVDTEWLERLGREGEVQPVIILLASRLELEDRNRLQRLGVRRVLLKPINHATLKITVAEELNYRSQSRHQHRSSTPDRPVQCLVAEDNLIATQVLVSMLEKLGVQYTAVTNGQQAVEACQRQDFDLVLMDGDMPIMDGWEAASRIRDSQQARGAALTPIIALTANTIEELGERARRSVMDAHLVKPINLSELRALIERWTGKVLQ